MLWRAGGEEEEEAVTREKVGRGSCCEAAEAAVFGEKIGPSLLKRERGRQKVFLLFLANDTAMSKHACEKKSPRLFPAFARRN